MRNVIMVLVLIAIIGAIGYVVSSKMNPKAADSVTFKNVASETLTVQAGGASPATLAAGAEAEAAFDPGMLVKVWVGSSAKGPTVGWRLHAIGSDGIVNVSYSGDVLSLEGAGLELTQINNSTPTAPTPASESEAPEGAAKPGT